MTPHSTLAETKARVRLLTTLCLAHDPVAAVFEGVSGPPDKAASIILRRLGFLKDAGVVSCVLLAAAEVVEHRDLPEAVRLAILAAVGSIALDEGGKT